MAAFFILPDAQAGDARDYLYISLDGNTQRIDAETVAWLKSEVDRLRMRNDNLYSLASACESALAEFERITGDIGFEPERFRERLAIVSELSAAITKAKGGTE